jgi:lipopolysaccharide/colanic/teichoic acid biosynthesis glycosyltransferase
MLKFRSMFCAARGGMPSADVSGRDPRVTRVGRVIRGLKLDELPQLVNVLKGEMSILGPRPELLR